MKILSLRARAKIQPRGSKVEKLPEPDIVESYFTASQVEELRNCTLDPKYFIDNYIFKLRPAQSRFLEYVQEFKGVVCKHPRQIGMTQASMAYLLWDAMFNSHKTIVALLPKYAMAQDCQRIVLSMWDSLPDFMKCGIKYRNRHQIEFDNRSMITFRAVTEDACRGLTVSTLYLGDLAYADRVHAELMWAVVAPCIGTGSKIICHSSPTDQFHLFADMYKAALKGRDHWAALAFEYWDRDQSTYDEFLRLQSMMSQAQFRREFMAEFVTA